MSAQSAADGEKKSVWAGFREFLMRGNVVELAVAVVVGNAFSKIVDAMVKGVVNPLVGAFGTKDLDMYEFCLRGPCKVNETTGEIISGVPVKWGPVLSASLTFLITAAVVYFLMILPMNKYKERRDAKNPPAPAGPTEVELLSEIRDLLVTQRDGSTAPDDTDSEGPGGSPDSPVGPQRGAVDTEKS